MKRRSFLKRDNNIEDDDDGTKNRSAIKRRRRAHACKQNADDENSKVAFRRRMGSGDDGDLPSDTAECSLFQSSNMVASKSGDDTNNQIRSKRKLLKNNAKGESGSVAVTQTAAKTLFSAVMSRSNNTPRPDRISYRAEADAGAEAPEAENYADVSKKETTTTSDVTFLKKIGTPTLMGKLKSRWQKKSPANSPGGYEILRALDDANTHGYYQEQKSDEEDALDGDGDVDEEWHDATVHFFNPLRDENNEGHHLCNVETKEDLTEVMNAEKNDSTKVEKLGQLHLLQSSIVEATKFATDFDDDDPQHNMDSPSIFPDPIGVGFMDWSLKRRIRLECVPGRCLPESLSASDVNEGFVHQLALQELSNWDREGKSSCHPPRNNSSIEELAMAKWLASTMYYQHPAVHPLPPSLLTQSKNTNDSGPGAPSFEPGNTRRDLSSFIQGSHSIHNRVRRPAAGCMGGLGTSMMPSDNRGGVKASSNSNQEIKSKPTNIATVSHILDQRRHNWQEAFRSMFQSWKSKLKDLENRAADVGGRSYNGGSCATTTHKSSAKCKNSPTQDELSRCSFYSILPHQIILFRGGYAEVGDNDGASFQNMYHRNKSCSTKGAKHRIVPMIVFSSTTPQLRLKLKSMGVDLRIFTPHKSDDAIEGGTSRYDVFNENRLRTEDVLPDAGNGAVEGGKDAESVHAELDAIKWADDEKGKVTVERKKKTRQRLNDNLTGGANLPPLFVSGDDDCAATYEILMNTHGLSVDLKNHELPKKNVCPTTVLSSTSDVPLLLCRSLGPCLHTTLRKLCISSRRDCGYMNQVYINSSSGITDGGEQQQSSSTARAALEMRGPMLPCALRDLTCAMVNFMLLDKKYRKQDQLSTVEQPWDDADENESRDASMRSHQFAMFLQAHEGEGSISRPELTGSSSSLRFNGSDVPLLLKREDHNGSAPTAAWRECRHGDFINVLVWDFSRKSVVSFNPLSAKT